MYLANFLSLSRNSMNNTMHFIGFSCSSNFRVVLESKTLMDQVSKHLQNSDAIYIFLSRLLNVSSILIIVNEYFKEFKVICLLAFLISIFFSKSNPIESNSFINSKNERSKMAGTDNFNESLFTTVYKIYYLLLCRNYLFAINLEKKFSSISSLLSLL